MSTQSRGEHLAWCKQRALEYADRGDIEQAFSSMASDLGKHAETANHIGIHLGAMMLFAGHIKTAADIRKFIEGFN